MSLDELPPERDPWKEDGRSELDEWIRRAKDALWRGFKQRSPRNVSPFRQPQWRRSLPWAVALLLGAWLASGLSSVVPGQIALLYAFGSPVREVHLGNFWNWPAPLGRVIYEAPAKPHSRYVVFHAFTQRGFPVLVTIHYRYQKNHPRAAILFATHPGLWLRGLLMSALTRWSVVHDRLVRSPREPQRQPVMPVAARFRRRLNQILSRDRAGLVLLHLGIAIAPGRVTRAAWKKWQKQTANEQADARTLKRKLDSVLARLKLQALQKEGRAEVRIQRWIGQARILVARFHVLLPVYREHPTLVQQTLIHVLYEKPGLRSRAGTASTRPSGSSLGDQATRGSAGAKRHVASEQGRA